MQMASHARKAVACRRQRPCKVDEGSPLSSTHHSFTLEQQMIINDYIGGIISAKLLLKIIDPMTPPVPRSHSRVLMFSMSQFCLPARAL
jgi:hypothetical protein